VRVPGRDGEPGELEPVAERTLQITDEIDPEESILESDDGLVEWLRDEYGDDLRVVGVYTETTFEMLYMAEKVREQYSRDEIYAMSDEFIMSDSRENTYLERLFHLGRIKYVVHGFDDGQVFRIPLDQGTGLIVSVASTTDVSLPVFIRQLKSEHAVTFR
jgi:hypothetical protein